jgi:hypothetical protein
LVINLDSGLGAETAGKDYRENFENINNVENKLRIPYSGARGGAVG